MYINIRICCINENKLNFFLPHKLKDKTLIRIKLTFVWKWTQNLIYFAGGLFKNSLLIYKLSVLKVFIKIIIYFNTEVFFFLENMH